MKTSKGRQPSQSRKLVLLLGIASVFCLAFWLVQRRSDGLRHKLLSETGKEQATGLLEASTKASMQAPNVDECDLEHQHQHTEYWGAVVKSGMDMGKTKGLETSTAMACCMACKATLGCNIWVWCSDQHSCGSQCWLKRVGSPHETQRHGNGPGVPWTSGAVAKDYNRDVASLPAVDPNLNTVALTTTHGSIRIRLYPEWSESSVEYLRRLAMTPELCSPQCEFYRAEPGFLLQGSLAAFIPANNKTTPGPKIMERGEIGWAGGSAGPDFFIYLGKEPATHFGHDHTVWGAVADEASLAVVETIVALPAEAPKPGDMHMMVERESFKISVTESRPDDLVVKTAH